MELDREFVLVLGFGLGLGLLKHSQKLGIFPPTKNTRLLNYHSIIKMW